jgi:hypothetical protein
MKKLLCVLVLCFSSTRLLALNYSSSELKFTATLPDNLEDVSVRVGIRGALITLGKWNAATNGLVKIVSIQDLGAPIDRQEVSKQGDHLANVTQEKATWKTRQIDVSRGIETEGGITNVTFNARMPLMPHAIQITVKGPVADENSLRGELQAIVTSVEGETGGVSVSERFFDRLSGFGWIIAGGVILFIFLVAVINMLGRRPYK